MGNLSSKNEGIFEDLQLSLQPVPQRMPYSKKIKNKAQPSHSLKVIVFFTALIVTLTVIGAVFFPVVGAAIDAGIGFAFTATCIVGYIAFNYLRQKYHLYSHLYGDSNTSTTYAQTTSHLCKQGKTPVNTVTDESVSPERDDIDEAQEDKITSQNPIAEQGVPLLKPEDHKEVVEGSGLTMH